MSRFVRALCALSLVLFCAPGALAQEPPPPPPFPPPPPPPTEDEPDNGQAFLVISLEDTFGSDTPTIVVPLGVIVGGAGVTDAVFTPEDAILIPVTYLDDISFASLDGNATTIIGTFRDGETVPHLVNSTTTAVPDEVEEAIYNATRDPGFSDLFYNSESEQPLFPTPSEIATFIAGFQPLSSEGEVDEEDVAAVEGALFETDDALSLPSETSPTIEAEGDLFPHDDYTKGEEEQEEEGPTPLFQFSFLVNNQGNFDLALCNEIIEVEVDIVNQINLNQKGLAPVKLYGSADFDVEDVVPLSATLGGVTVVKEKISDLNGDGIDDMTLHFSIPALVAGGFLNASTVDLQFAAELEGDSDVCIVGSDTVSIVSSKK